MTTSSFPGPEGRRDRDAMESLLWNYAEFDTPEEVDAVFRAQRRLSIGHGLLFLVVTALLPVLHVAWPAWSTTAVWGGLTPAFIAATVLYPLFCIILAASYSMRANRMDEDLLGRVQTPGRAWEVAGEPAQGDP